MQKRRSENHLPPLFISKKGQTKRQTISARLALARRLLKKLGGSRQLSRNFGLRYFRALVMHEYLMDEYAEPSW
jgi:hypothetical protein